MKNCLEKIDESSEHLLSLINDILDLTSIESGKVNYNPVPVDVKSVHQQLLLKRHWHSFIKKKIRCTEVTAAVRRIIFMHM